ncbi:MAG: AAA family ATPase [Proteobacteria bacterium]|nr:AAA family ATPase [Pseudomonadota bacterium]
MAKVKPLPAKALCKRCDPKQFTFKTTDQLKDFDDIIGQERAVEAIEFGMGIRHKGYNLFVLGPPGTGRHGVIRRFVERQALEEEVPSDWCYINNFGEAHEPRVIELPPGKGAPFQKDMAQLIEELGEAVQAAFNSDDYRARVQAIKNDSRDKNMNFVQEIERLSKEKSLTPVQSPAGMTIAPLAGDQVMTPEAFEKLPEEQKERIQKDIDELQKYIQDGVLKGPQMEREEREKIKQLGREMTRVAAKTLLTDIRQRYREFSKVTDYLDEVETDVVERAEAFRRKDPPAGAEGMPPSAMPFEAEQELLNRYKVNLIVDNRKAKGAPVVYEDNPSLHNLMGRIDHVSQFGTLKTDFNLIKSGALLRANGGYLMLDIRKVLMQPMVWEELKRALRSGEIRIEPMAQLVGLVSTVSLKPEPIPLEIKIIMVGERRLYYMLSALDPDFSALFKVAVDFSDRIDRTPESDVTFARLIATTARKEGLRTLDRGAVARMIEQGSRMAGDSDKLSTQLRHVFDLLREADFAAKKNGNGVITSNDVDQAIRAQIYRVDRLRSELQEEIHRGTILIDTDGEKVGQVNGLSVLQLGGYAFGRPSRITARTRLGQGKVLDIEREVDLGGPTHSKGVLILTGYLGARYAEDKPLSLSASLVFEQSYGGVDGDSASSAELYALLSSLSKVPIKQSLAVTGSVNQHGQVQAIGGVNQKIEGFFDVCQQGGLAGDQGVLIPASNVKNLMLRHDVIEAVKMKKFNIYPVETVDQGIQILTGIAPGKRGRSGSFPKGTINRLVEDALTRLADQGKSSNK